MNAWSSVTAHQFKLEMHEDLIEHINVIWKNSEVRRTHHCMQRKYQDLRELKILETAGLPIYFPLKLDAEILSPVRHLHFGLNSASPEEKSNFQWSSISCIYMNLILLLNNIKSTKSWGIVRYHWDALGLWQWCFDPEITSDSKAIIWRRLCWQHCCCLSNCNYMNLSNSY